MPATLCPHCGAKTEVADGWLAVALAPVTQAGSGRTSPTAARIDAGGQRTFRR